MPFESCSDRTHKPAVNPAVPIIIDSRVPKFSGRGEAHSLGILIYSPKPPAVPMPISYPETTTFAPALNSKISECSMTPTASIPGVCG